MDDGLNKSRRNLIVVSVVLVIFDVAAVSITKVSVLGTELLVGNPAVVHAFLWVLWAYLLVRYAQFLGAENDLGIRNAFLQKMDRLLIHKIAETSQLQEPRWQANLGEIGYSRLTRTGLTWRQRLFRYEPSQGESVELTPASIPGYIVIFALFRASLYVAFMTPKATEHIFPLVLAIAAPIVSIFR